MTIQILIYALIVTAGAAVLLVPVILRRDSAIVSRAASAKAMLREKLEQVDRDHAAGAIDAAEAGAARAEISRSLIATAREAADEASMGRIARGPRVAMIAVATVAIAAGVGVYATVGSFNRADQPLASRQAGGDIGMPTLASDHEGSQMIDAIKRLRARLETSPDDVENWYFLARSYSAVGAFKLAAEAYARVIELAPFQVDVRGDYAETLVRADGGFVGPKAVAEFEVVLTHAPNDPRALYYLALRDAQAGESLKAAERWAQILRQSPPDAPYRPAIRGILNAIIEDAGLDRASLDLPDEPGAGSSPTAAMAADIAARPAGEQMEMIRGMVEGLEARLADEPGDVEGWLRLARSRSVLGEPEAAAAALERALSANPGNTDLTAALTQLRAQ